METISDDTLAIWVKDRISNTRGAIAGSPEQFAEWMAGRIGRELQARRAKDAALAELLAASKRAAYQIRNHLTESTIHCEPDAPHVVAWRDLLNALEPWGMGFNWLDDSDMPKPVQCRCASPSEQ